MERTAKLAPDVAEVHYDLAVIRLANGNSDGALQALRTAVDLNPKLKDQAAKDGDLDALQDDKNFAELIAN